MYQFFFGLQAVGVLLLLVLTEYILFHCKTRLHNILLFYCVAALVNHVGYLFEMTCDTLDEYLKCTQISYVGRVWLAFAMFLFCLNLCRVHISRKTIFALASVHLLVLFSVMHTQVVPLYYKNIGFNMDGTFPHMTFEPGIMHSVNAIFNVIYIAIGLYCLFRTTFREKNKTAKMRLMIVSTGVFLEAGFYILQVFRLAKEYDLSMIGHIMEATCLSLAIFAFKFLDNAQLARDFVIDELTEAIVAVNNKGELEYCNKPAKMVFGNIYENPKAIVDNLQEHIYTGKPYEANHKIYSIKMSELLQDNEICGKVYSLVDETEHYLYLKELREQKDIAEEAMERDRIMRHDRRHFEAMVFSLLNDSKVEEAKKLLKERLNVEPRTSCKYCENKAVNATLVHYMMKAKSLEIEPVIEMNIPEVIDIDDMELAIAIGNLFENAIHACEKLETDKRFIKLSAKYRNQLLLQIENACEESECKFDEMGYPVSERKGHGIGTKSVLFFINKVDGDINYQLNDGVFKVRMVISA